MKCTYILDTNSKGLKTITSLTAGVLIAMLIVTFLIIPHAKSSVLENVNWQIHKIISTTVKNMRIVRIENDLALFMGTDDNKFGVAKLDTDNNFFDAKVVATLPTGEKPYAMRMYTKQYVLINTKESNFLEIFRFNPNATVPIEHIQRLGLGSVSGSVDFTIDDRSGLAYVPGNSSDNMSIVDLKPLLNSQEAQLITIVPLIEESKPFRVALINSDILLTINYGNATVSIFNVSNPYDPVLVNNIMTGKTPTYGDGNGKIFVVNSTDDPFITVLDISDPYNIHRLDSVSQFVVGESSLIPLFVDTNTMLLTVQGKEITKNPDAQGKIVAFNISDYRNPSIISSVITRRGCGGISLVPATANNPDYNIVVTVNTIDGTLSWVDISDLSAMKILQTTFFPNGGQPQSIKFFANGKYALVPDKTNNHIIILSEQQYRTIPTRQKFATLLPSSIPSPQVQRFGGT